MSDSKAFSFDEIKTLLGRVKYKRGWVFTLRHSPEAEADFETYKAYTIRIETSVLVDDVPKPVYSLYRYSCTYKEQHFFDQLLIQIEELEKQIRGRSYLVDGRPWY